MVHGVYGLSIQGPPMRHFLILLFSATSLHAFSQRISNFNLVTAGSYVGVRFTILAGAQCSGYRVYRSTDAYNYQVIYDYPGICGSYNASEDKSYTDMGPVQNQTNYYKVELVPIEMSQPLQIYVSPQSRGGMFVYPNPVERDGQITLVLTNTNKDVYLTGHLFTQTGAPLQAVNLATSANKASFGVNGLRNGLYILWLTDGEQAYAARFVVLN